jgi:hypothetical protein
MGGSRVQAVAPLFAALLSIPFGERYPPLTLSPLAAGCSRHYSINSVPSTARSLERLVHIGDIACGRPAIADQSNDYKVTCVAGNRVSGRSDGQASFYREHLTALGTHRVCRDFARRVAVLVTRRQPWIFPGRCRNWVMRSRGYSGCHHYLTPRLFLRLSKYPASLPMSRCRPVMIVGQLDRLQTVNTHGALQNDLVTHLDASPRLGAS